MVRDKGDNMLHKPEHAPPACLITDASPGLGKPKAHGWYMTSTWFIVLTGYALMPHDASSCKALLNNHFWVANCNELEDSGILLHQSHVSSC